MRVKKMTIEEGQRVGISRFPNFHKTGSVRGMKKLYYGDRCLLVRCGDYIYTMYRPNHKSTIRQQSNPNRYEYRH